MAVPELDEYLESRIQQNIILEEITKGKMKEDKYPFTTSSPWLNNEKFSEEMLH